MLIERQAAIEELKYLEDRADDFDIDTADAMRCQMSDAEEAINELPEVEAIPVEWLQKKVEETRARGEEALRTNLFLEANFLNEIIEEWVGKHETD